MHIVVGGKDDIFGFLSKLDERMAKKVIPQATQHAYDNLKTFAKPHYQSGSLYRNIRHRVGTLSGLVWIDDTNMLVNWRGKRINYAIFVLQGTKPHPITPKRRKALRLELNDFVFRKKVHHPGYAGDDFIKKAIEKTFRELDAIIRST